MINYIEKHKAAQRVETKKKPIEFLNNLIQSFQSGGIIKNSRSLDRIKYNFRPPTSSKKKKGRILLEEELAKGGEIPDWLYEARGRAMKEGSERLQQGGDLARVESIFKANPNVRFLQRMHKSNIKGIPSPYDDRLQSSHLLSYATVGEPGREKYRVYPEVQEIDSKLKHIPGWLDALRSAEKANNYIDFDTEEEAKWFSGGKDSWKAWHSSKYNTKFAKGGKWIQKALTPSRGKGKRRGAGSLTAAAKSAGESISEYCASPPSPLAKKRCGLRKTLRGLEEGDTIDYKKGGLTGGLTGKQAFPKGKDKGKRYPMVKESDFARPESRKYPIGTIQDGADALRLARMHGADDVIQKVYKRYPELKPKKDKKGGAMRKYELGDRFDISNILEK